MALFPGLVLLSAGLKFIVDEALQDTEDARNALLEDEEDLDDLLYALKGCKGATIAVIDDNKNTIMQGRVRRIRGHSVVIDTRRAEIDQSNGSIVYPPLRSGQDLKTWIPQIGQQFVLLSDEEDEDEDE